MGHHRDLKVAPAICLNEILPVAVAVPHTHGGAESFLSPHPCWHSTVSVALAIISVML